MIATRLRPRRRLPLRVVNPSNDSTPHAVAFEHAYSRLRVEVWTDAEWDKLTEAERDPRAGILPGIGWIVMYNIAEDEAQDLGDIQRQACQLWRMQRDLE